MEHNNATVSSWIRLRLWHLYHVSHNAFQSKPSNGKTNGRSLLFLPQVYLFCIVRQPSKTIIHRKVGIESLSPKPRVDTDIESFGRNWKVILTNLSTIDNDMNKSKREKTMVVFSTNIVFFFFYFNNLT